MGRFYIILIWGLVIAMSSCCKETPKPETLPAITNTGEGTFGCLFDGKKFVSSVCPPLGEELLPWYWVNWESFRIRVTNEHHFGEPMRIELSLKDFNGSTGIHYLSNEYDDRPFRDWELDSLTENYIDFTTFDTIAKIASGTFQFTCSNPDDSLEVLKVTEGRFDLPHMHVNYYE